MRAGGPQEASAALDISKKTDYALRMISALVKNPGSVVSVRTVAEENHIPYSFARTIQHDLVEAGIIESLRGSHGGMRLVVDPERTTLLQVVEAIQGPVCISSCDQEGGGEPCPNEATCTFSPIWRGARELLADYFSSVTLSEAVWGTKGPSAMRAHATARAAHVGRGAA